MKRETCDWTSGAWACCLEPHPELPNNHYAIKPQAAAS